jgi:bifunctional non-homologous end joining protein LigD
MAFQPMPLSRKPAPFDHPEWVFELKYDGFRSLAIIHSGRCELVSRNGHPFNSFTALRKGLTSPYQGKTVLDGEIVCLDKRGKPQFNDLLFHRGEPCFFAFDLLMADGKDLRTEKLTDRKHELRRLLSTMPDSRMKYVQHVEQHGKALFERVCKLDLEGIVAKHSHGLGARICNLKINSGIAQSNMQRRGQIKASPVGSVPSRDVPTVDPQSARIARWNVVDVRSAGSATTTI